MGAAAGGGGSDKGRQSPSRQSCPSCSIPLGVSGSCPNPDCPQSAAYQPRRKAPASQAESTARSGHGSIFVDEASPPVTLLCH